MRVRVLEVKSSLLVLLNKTELITVKKLYLIVYLCLKNSLSCKLFIQVDT